MTAPGPDLRMGSRAQPAFRLFALAGLAAGIATALAVDRVPPAALAVTAAGGMLAALGVLALRVAVTGRGDLVWSEHPVAEALDRGRRVVPAGGPGARPRRWPAR